MGLFTNNKKLCPVCGKPTPRFLAASVEDKPLCKECAAKIDLPNGALGKMTLDSFIKYTNFYDDNQVLRDVFKEDYHYDFGFLSDTLRIDTVHQLFRIKSPDTSFVMQSDNLKNFRILEDTKPLFEGDANGLKCYKSEVPDRVKAMSSQIEQFMVERRDYEWMERREKMEEERRQNNRPNQALPPVIDSNNRRTSTHFSEPRFNTPGPVKKFYVEINLKHPYWGSIKWEIKAPSFNSEHPSVDDYLIDYDNKVDKLKELAEHLMRVANPDAGEIRVE